MNDSKRNAGVKRRDILRGGAALTAAVAAGSVTTDAEAASSGGTGECMEVPPADAEKFTTTCQYCMVQCGYNVLVWERGKGKVPKGEYTSALSGEWISPSFVVPAEKNGKQVYVAVVPDKGCVVNEGEYSVRGGTNALTLFSKNLPSANKRLSQPMIRKGGKGSPLVSVSWDEAVAFTAENLTRLKSAHGPDSLGLIRGDWLFTLPTYAILKLFFTGIGSSSHAGNGWFFDEESAGVSAAFGTGTRSFTVQDFDTTKLLVTAGTNLMANGSVYYERFYQRNLSTGNAKHIDIDPRRTPQGRHAEENGGLHLQLKPGTDAILAAALMRLVLERDAYDKEFVAKYVSGFDVLRNVVMNERFSLAGAAAATEVPADKIQRAADLLIEARGQSMLLHEKGIMHQLGAFEHQHAYVCLGVILGNVGKPGACTSRAGGHPAGTFASPPEPKSREHNTNIYAALEQGKIKSIWAFACNIFKQSPSLTKHRPLMENTFLIVQDRIKTEMNEAADVIFPAATWGEADGVLASVDRRVRLQQKFMDPPGIAKPDWWIVAQVAKKMGYTGFDWTSPAQVWDEVRQLNGDIKEISWEMLKGGGTNGIQLPFVNGKSVQRLFSDDAESILGKRFKTKDDKIHVEKIRALETFDPSKNEWRDVRQQYPLMAIDFRLDELWNTGYTYWDKPTVNRRTPDAFLMIHPSDAARRNIKTGMWVKLRSPYGECRARARVTQDVRPGVVGMPALFPKPGQEFNYATSPEVSPVNGDHVTMVACDILLA